MSPTITPTSSSRIPHAQLSDVVLDDLDSSHNGLSSSEANQRLSSIGPNRLAETPPTPAWKRFIAQFSNLLTIILIAAAIISLVVSREVKTPAVVFVVVFMNAIIGFVQENKAEASLAALRRMLASSARVKRDGAWINVDTADIVPGDIVLVEAGDRIPADGRLLTATNLEIEEAALTGESLAVI